MSNRGYHHDDNSKKHKRHDSSSSYNSELCHQPCKQNKYKCKDLFVNPYLVKCGYKDCLSYSCDDHHHDSSSSSDDCHHKSPKCKKLFDSPDTVRDKCKKLKLKKPKCFESPVKTAVFKKPCKKDCHHGGFYSDDCSFHSDFEKYSFDKHEDKHCHKKCHNDSPKKHFESPPKEHCIPVKVKHCESPRHDHGKHCDESSSSSHHRHDKKKCKSPPAKAHPKLPFGYFPDDYIPHPKLPSGYFGSDSSHGGNNKDHGKCDNKKKNSSHCDEDRHDHKSSSSHHHHHHDCPPPQPVCADNYRRYIWRPTDGMGNNLEHPVWGKAHEDLIRICPPDYNPETGMATRGSTNPNPRVISNLLCKGDSPENPIGLSDITWMFGQFIDHEIDLTPPQSGATAERADIPTLASDPNEDFPGRIIPFTRSQFNTKDKIREQPTEISGFFDGGNVYGNDTAREVGLRRLDGTGKLKTSLSLNAEVLPPHNTEGLPNDSANPNLKPAELFLVGDVRGNENIALTAMHTLFVREHNRLCDTILEQQPNLAGQDEMLYQLAKKFIVGFIQNIAYQEFLPALLGPRFEKEYQGYNADVDATVATEFSTVGFRVGHTMVSSNLQIGNPKSPDSFQQPLRDSFFNPGFVDKNGINRILEGAVNKRMQALDIIVVEDIRTFLFDAPTAHLLHDLAALNIQRGRDHGIAGYNAVRVAYGLSRIEKFENLPMSKSIQEKLASLYDHPDSIDPWVGALAEDHLTDSQVGPLLFEIISDQFYRFREGDRFFFLNDISLSPAEKLAISRTTLSQIIARNTDFAFPVQENAFFVPGCNSA